jgi:hypothetical protein
MLDAQSKKILHFVSYFSHHKQAIATVLKASAVHLYCEVVREQAGEWELLQNKRPKLLKIRYFGRLCFLVYENSFTNCVRAISS